MSDTPRTDEAIGTSTDQGEAYDKLDTLCRQLEGENAKLLGALYELANAADDRLTRPPRGVGDSLLQRQRLEEAVAQAKRMTTPAPPHAGRAQRKGAG